MGITNIYNTEVYKHKQIQTPSNFSFFFKHARIMVLIGVHELVDINYRFMILYSQCDIHREAVCLRAGMQCRRAWGPGSAPKLSRLDFRTAAGEEGALRWDRRPPPSQEAKWRT